MARFTSALNCTPRAIWRGSEASISIRRRASHGENRRAVCLPTINGKQQLTVFDANTFAAKASVPFQQLEITRLRQVMPGSKGAVAVSYGISNAESALYLFKDAAF